MLESARRKAARLDPHFLAATISALDHDRLVTRHLTHPYGIRETALVADLNAVVLDDLRVDQAPDLVFVTLDHAHAQRHTDLVGCQAGAGSVEHGFSEVVDEELNRGVDARHLLRLFAKHGGFEGQYRPETHESDFTPPPFPPLPLPHPPPPAL